MNACRWLNWAQQMNAQGRARVHLVGAARTLGKYNAAVEATHDLTLIGSETVAARVPHRYSGPSSPQLMVVEGPRGARLPLAKPRRRLRETLGSFWRPEGESERGESLDDVCAFE